MASRQPPLHPTAACGLTRPFGEKQHLSHPRQANWRRALPPSVAPARPALRCGVLLHPPICKSCTPWSKKRIRIKPRSCSWAHLGAYHAAVGVRRHRSFSGCRVADSRSADPGVAGVQRADTLQIGATERRSSRGSAKIPSFAPFQIGSGPDLRPACVCEFLDRNDVRRSHPPSVH